MSLAPFVIVYDRQGQVLASSGQLSGQIPTLPSGILTGTILGTERKITWQPQPGVRIASVVVAAPQGYVLSGRSLREVEGRTSDLERFVAVAWALTIVLLALTFLASRFFPPCSRRGPVFQPCGLGRAFHPARPEPLVHLLTAATIAGTGTTVLA